MANKIDYSKLTEITVKNQAELDMIPLDFKGRIYIEFGTYFSPAIVRNKYFYSVEARENSDGKVRTSKVKVIREVPLSECGLYGKMLAKRKGV